MCIRDSANEYGLNVTVVGAADSATGSADINKSLGTSRAKFIAKELYKRGVASAQVTLVN